MKIPKITVEDVHVSFYSIHCEKITDKYDKYFPFSTLDEQLELIGISVEYSNIDDMGFLVADILRDNSNLHSDEIKKEFVRIINSM